MNSNTLNQVENCDTLEKRIKHLPFIPSLCQLNCVPAKKIKNVACMPSLKYQGLLLEDVKKIEKN